MHGADRRVVEGMRQQINGSLRAGEGVKRVAERVLDLDRDAVVNLPEYVQEMKQAATAARRAQSGLKLPRDQDIRQLAKTWMRRTRKLGQGVGKQPGAYTMRSASRHLIKRLEKATPAQVDKIVDRWTLDKAQYQARLIARHETVEAYRSSYRESTARQPYAKGYRWQLSGSHPVPDECDALANQDLHGMGPGGYPASGLPSTPHPACLCTQTVIVDEDHFARELAEMNGEPEPARPWESGKRDDPTRWYRDNPRRRAEILGPTRERIFREDPSRVIDSNGIPRPVWQAEGRPKITRRLGPARRIQPLVVADRRRMVEPLPQAPARVR